MLGYFREFTPREQAVRSCLAVTAFALLLIKVILLKEIINDLNPSTSPYPFSPIYFQEWIFGFLVLALSLVDVLLVFRAVSKQPVATKVIRLVGNASAVWNVVLAVILFGIYWLATGLGGGGSPPHTFVVLSEVAIPFMIFHFVAVVLLQIYGHAFSRRYEKQIRGFPVVQESRPPSKNGN